MGLCRYLTSVQPTLGLELDSGRLPDNEKRQEIEFEGGDGGLEGRGGGDGGWATSCLIPHQGYFNNES